MVYNAIWKTVKDFLGIRIRFFSQPLLNELRVFLYYVFLCWAQKWMLYINKTAFAIITLQSTAFCGPNWWMFDINLMEKPGEKKKPFMCLHLFSLGKLHYSPHYDSLNKKIKNNPVNILNKKAEALHIPVRLHNTPLNPMCSNLPVYVGWFIHEAWLGCKANISKLHHCVGKLLLVRTAC